MIRLMTAADLDAIVSIWLAENIHAHAFIPADYWQEQLPIVRPQFLAAQVYVYEEHQEILGFVGLVDSYIAGIFVTSTKQAKGIGTSLLNRLKQEKNQLTLQVYQKNNVALEFYHQAGFLIVNEQEDPITKEIEYTMAWSKN